MGKEFKKIVNVCITDILYFVHLKHHIANKLYSNKFFNLPSQNNNKVKWKNKTLKTKQRKNFMPGGFTGEFHTNTFFKKNRNTPQFILLGQYYLILKIEQTYEEKKNTD